MLTVVLVFIGGMISATIFSFSAPKYHNIATFISVAVFLTIIIILWFNQYDIIATSEGPLSPLQKDVQKYMDEVLDFCTMKKLWWKNQEGTVYIEIPECWDDNYPGKVTRTYTRCLDSVVLKWVHYTNPMPSSNMTWDKLKSEIIKCVPQHDCNPICYTGEPIPPPPL